MGNRRFAQVSTSDDEEDDDALPIRQRLQKKRQQKQSPISPESHQKKKKRKMTKLREDDDDDDEEEEFDEADEEELEEEEEDEEEEEAIDMEIEGDDSEEEEEKRKKKTRKRRTSSAKKNKKEEEEEEEEDDGGEKEEEEEGGGSKSEDEEDEPVDARPVGDPIKVTGKGKTRRSHYEAYEYDGNQYDLEDPVLITPESATCEVQKPYVAIIKDIAQDKDGNVMMTGQWFYRPEEAEKKGGGNWQSSDSRELFYSFHRDEVPAESVMHRCVVHFVPIHKQLPNRKQYPGFIVRKVYDTVEKKLWKLTDKDYEDKKQQEIDVLVHKTMKRLVDLPDIEPEENLTVVADQEESLKSKRSLRRKNISPLDVSRDEERPEQNPKAETPGSCLPSTSEYYHALVKSDVLTGDTHRDKWLERLLQSVHYVCSSTNGTNKDEKEKLDVNGTKQESHVTASEVARKDSQGFFWPDAAVTAVVALEKASHESLASDFQKYNQKIRQLVFNLKNNALLARRLLNGELKPSKILNMSPTELKEGLTAEETASKEPDESERMQMTGVRCSRCNELKVGVRDIIQAGHGERYQLECIACGHSWYGSRDDAATLTIDAPHSAPLATEKFEAVEKKIASPKDSENKLTEALIPVLETQKSFSKPKKDEIPEPDPNA